MFCRTLGWSRRGAAAKPVGRRRCTASPLKGVRRFVTYLEELEQVVRDALPKAVRKMERSPDVPPGFQPA